MLEQVVTFSFMLYSNDISVHKRKISIMVTGTDDELVAELILNIVDVTR